MTAVAFHFNVPDRVPYLCRLLRKVVGSGKRALVLGPSALLRELDQALWTFSQEDFLSHATAHDVVRVQRHSAILLSETPCDAGHSEILVNCQPDVPADFDRYERVLEVVGLDDQDRLNGRQRWKYYTQLGLDLVRHDAASTARGRP